MDATQFSSWTINPHQITSCRNTLGMHGSSHNNLIPALVPCEQPSQALAHDARCGAVHFIKHCPRLIFVRWGIFLQLWQGWVLTGFHNPPLSPVIEKGPGIAAVCSSRHPA